MLFLEKEKFNKILIFFTTLMLFVLMFSVSPVHASSIFDDSKNILIETSIAEGTEAVKFKNAKMIRNGSSTYTVEFDADFTIVLDESDQVPIDQNFLDNYANITVSNVFYTGFKFNFRFYDNDLDMELGHTGRVNLNPYPNHESDDIILNPFNYNSLNGFGEVNQLYTVIINGKSVLASNPEDVIYRGFYSTDEGYMPFPFALSASKPQTINYGGNNIPFRGLLSDNLHEYLNFEPYSVTLRFEGLSFVFDPYQEGMSTGNGLRAAGYDDVYIEDEQNLALFGYDTEATTKIWGDHPVDLDEDFSILSELRFERLIADDGSTPGIPGTPGEPGEPGTGTGGIFTIIPSIMIAIFSFFWMIGSVELGGIPGLTLVGITSFFVGFMIIKIIIGLFKGGGD